MGEAWTTWSRFCRDCCWWEGGGQGNEYVIFFYRREFTFLFLILITRIVHEFFQVTSLKMTRHQKRKIDETHVEVNTGKKIFSNIFCSILFIFLFVLKSCLNWKLKRNHRDKGNQKVHVLDGLSDQLGL